MKSQFFKDAHKAAKKQKAFYGLNRTYKQLLGEVLKDAYRAIKRAKEVVTEAIILAFEKHLSYIM